MQNRILTPELICRLHKITLFQDITSEEIPQVLGCVGFKIRTFSKGEIIFLENENIRHIGIVLSGFVDMIKEDVWGNKNLISRIEENNFFGESFALGNLSYSKVIFSAVSNTELMFIPFRRVIHTCTHACSHHRKLEDNVIKLIADKNVQLMEKIEIMSRKSLREKILCYLSIQSQKSGSMYFEIPFGRVALAEYLCADRSALTRELNRMKKEKIIDFDKNTFRILIGTM